MRKAKSVEDLTMEDLRKHPIWEWVVEEEGEDGQDETWVRPAAGSVFTEDMNGSIVSGKLTASDGTQYAVMVSLYIENGSASVDSAVLHIEDENEYVAIEDMIKELQFPVYIEVNIETETGPFALRFRAGKADVYKQDIRTHFA